MLSTLDSTVAGVPTWTPRPTCRIICTIRKRMMVRPGRRRRPAPGSGGRGPRSRRSGAPAEAVRTFLLGRPRTSIVSLEPKKSLTMLAPCSILLLERRAFHDQNQTNQINKSTRVEASTLEGSTARGGKREVEQPSRRGGASQNLQRSTHTPPPPNMVCSFILLTTIYCSFCPKYSFKIIHY